MGHNGCDGSQASGPWAIGSGYRFNGAGMIRWRPVLGLGFLQYTRTSLSVTHQSRVCPSPFDRPCVCVYACACFTYGSIWLPITWVISRPPIKQDLG